MRSPTPPSVLAATRALFALRVRMTWRTLARSTSAQVAGAGAFLLVFPAASQIGDRAAHALSLMYHPAYGKVSVDAFPAVCSALILLALLYVALLLAGGTGGGTVMESPPPAVLRGLPMPPGVLLLTDALGFALSLPTLFFVVSVTPLLWSVGNRGVLPLMLLALFCVALALLLTRLGALLIKRGRGAAVLAALAGTLFAACVLRVTPAAALQMVLTKQHERLRYPWNPPLPPPLTIPAVLRDTPPGFAAACVVGGSGNTPLFLLLAGAAALAIGSVVALDRFSGRAEIGSDAGLRRAASGVPRSANPIRTEMRLLLRDPAAHLSLRTPATLLLAVFFAWLAPNSGDDAVGNLVDLVGMGAALYATLWQVQLCCNRFGNDAVRAGTLFSLPSPRWRLIAAKNAALLPFLLVLDGVVVAGVASLSGNPRLIPTLLVGLVAVLVPLAALGNVVSVLAPFPLRRGRGRFEREPERSLAFVYCAVGVGTWLLLLPTLAMASAWGAVGYLAGGAYVTGLYAASVWLAVWLLNPARERRLVALLDGTK